MDGLHITRISLEMIGKKELHEKGYSLQDFAEQAIALLRTGKTEQFPSSKMDC